MSQWQFVNGRWFDVLNWQTADENIADIRKMNVGWDGLALPCEDILDLCGCGNPDLVVEAMVEYLKRAGATGVFRPPTIREGADHLSDLLLAYMADRLELTEHGSSIYTCWLTPAGLEYLALYERESSG